MCIRDRPHRGKVMSNLGAQKRRSLQKQTANAVPATPMATTRPAKKAIVVEESPPPTGKPSPRKRRTANQIEQDLICKPVNGCNHSDEDNPLLAEWPTWNAGYYTDAHQKKLTGKGTKFPTSCAGTCNKKFVGGGVKNLDKNKHCKVTALSLIHI